jgi:MFS family permease
MPRPTLPRNVIALSLVSLFTDVSSEMIYPLVPTFLATVLGAGAMSVGAIEGVAESVAALLKLASGWWSDRVPRRKPLVVAGYGLASVLRPLIGVAASVAQVFAIRLGDRVGKGLRSAPRDALIADSVAPGERGRAFGVHRAADHAGAVVGPLAAFVLLQWVGVGLRTVFLLAGVPAAIAMAVLVLGVREEVTGEGRGGRTLPTGGNPHAPRDASAPLGRRFHAYLAILVLFTLGNSTDAFLLLRARDLGISIAAIPLLWALLHIVKSLSSLEGGKLSDRMGRRPLISAGWLVYAAVYLGFARASAPWHGWALFAVYGVYFGLTEGVEKALVADLVAPAQRGRAFGWYNLAIGIGALPASLLFGAIWEHWGAPVAFTAGAGAALAATIGLQLTLPRASAPA